MSREYMLELELPRGPGDPDFYGYPGEPPIIQVNMPERGIYDTTETNAPF